MTGRACATYVIGSDTYTVTSSEKFKERGRLKNRGAGSHKGGYLRNRM
jgi:hypothetical protein